MTATLPVVSPSVMQTRSNRSNHSIRNNRKHSSSNTNRNNNRNIINNNNSHNNTRNTVITAIRINQLHQLLWPMECKHRIIQIQACLLGGEDQHRRSTTIHRW